MSIERTARYSEEVKKVVSHLIQNDLKDPRIPMLTSITKVTVTKDLRYAKIYVSVFGNQEQKVKCIEGLKSAAGYIRHEVASKIKSYYTPEMIFEIDNSIEQGIHISKLIDEVSKKK